MKREAYKTVFMPLCDQGGCKKLASYSVFGAHGTHLGNFCEHHADEKVNSLNNYEAAVRAALR